MRRLNLSKNSRKAQERESGAGISAAAIIARAAATVPDSKDRDEPRFSALPAESTSGIPSFRPQPIDPPARRNRRARRRPLRILGDQLRGRRRWIGRSALLIALFGFPVWLWQTGRLDTAVSIVDQSAASASEDFRSALGLRLEHIYVAGRRRTSRRPISAALGLDRGASLTSIDIVSLRARLRALPWISDVAIERRWPNVLFIRVREHTAIARYRQAGRTMLISRDGAVINVSAETGHQDKLLVKGAGAPAKAATLLTILRTRPILANRVVSATRHGKRRWDLKFDNGAYLKLPERRPDAAWQRFSDLNRTHQLLLKGAVGFDMRTRFEFVIETPHGGDESDARRSKPPAGRNTASRRNRG